MKHNAKASLIALISAFASNSAVAQEEGARSEATVSLEQITVTATRREQLVQDTAGGLQVFSGEALDQSGADGYADYILSVPGVSFRDQGTGAKRVALRGVSNAPGSDFSSGATVSTVGLYIDDVPIQGTSVMADLSLFDLNRIEVMKGPQGTLYGEGAMGGAIKMVLNRPEATEFYGKADIAGSFTEEGSWNRRLRTAVNIPIMQDRVALRVVGSYRSDSGYVDNVATGHDDINSEDAYSIRGLLAANLTDNLSADLLVMRDNAEMDDFSHVEKPLGDLRIDGIEDNFYHVQSSIYALTLKYDAGFAEATSVTSYYESNRDYVYPFPLALRFLQPFSTVPLGEPSYNDNQLHSFAQEVRLVSAGDNRFDWILGAFYRNKKQDADAQFILSPPELASVNAGLAAAGRPVYTTPLWFRRETTDEFTQRAFYGEGLFEIATGLELSLGLRYYREESQVSDLQTGSGYTSFFSTGGFSRRIVDDGVVPKVSLSYKASDSQLYYALAAKGFRSGTINFNFVEAGDEGATSDNLWNYELGAKTQWADNRVLFNVTAFFIDWKDIQGTQIGISRVTGLPRPFVDNGGNAEIYGAEVEFVTLPSQHLQLGATLGYTHSELVDPVTSPSLKGAVLPNSPEWTANGFVEYRAPVFADKEAFARLDVRHTGEQATRLITATVDGFFVDSYTTADLSLGLKLGDTAGTLTLFVNNLADERAELGRGVTGASSLSFPERYAIARPRTVGLTYAVDF